MRRWRRKIRNMKRKWRTQNQYHNHNTSDQYYNRRRNYDRGIVYNPIPRVRPEQLTCGEKYPMRKLERIATRYGPSLVASIVFQDVHSTLFLPKSYCEKLTDEELENIQNNGPFELLFVGPKYYGEFKSYEYKLFQVETT